MHTVPISQFRANVSAMLDLAERGETVRIMRRGKLVAELIPIRTQQLAATVRVPSWKRPFDPVKLPPGISLSQAVLDERDDRPERCPPI